MTDYDNLLAAMQSGSLDQVRFLLANNPELVLQRDQLGATPLHHAAFNGQQQMAELLIEHGADINAIDSRYHATPAGWAIEYLRERGALLGIELADFAFAIQNGNVEWVERMLLRFPKLKHSRSIEGVPFGDLAQSTANPKIIALLNN